MASPSRLSQSLTLRIAASVFATLFIGFGINALLNPTHALTFFEMAPPSSPYDKTVVDALMAVYGVRDIFMGVAIYAAAYYGESKSLGWIVLSGSAVAFADGAIWLEGGVNDKS
ncbi:hypothetical protein G7Y89_g9165 [Cudoniella acicularis]|uniref:Uncharacterized protein n=1 Tax=Cudoniella acicularis TaxID=354080 RepID=A0A8H4RF62_9HELO|nr:hypothetical protein G7Y89_g9165 [Cudoniella acicularis]